MDNGWYWTAQIRDVPLYEGNTVNEVLATVYMFNGGYKDVRNMIGIIAQESSSILNTLAA